MQSGAETMPCCCLRCCRCGNEGGSKLLCKVHLRSPYVVRDARGQSMAKAFFRAELAKSLGVPRVSLAWLDTGEAVPEATWR